MSANKYQVELVIAKPICVYYTEQSGLAWLFWLLLSHTRYPYLAVITSVSTTQKVQTQRQAWIDIAKGLGISLVVYAHVQRGLIKADILNDNRFWQALDHLIYSFHMPLFFALSGYFLLATLQKYGATGLLKSKLRSLAYPYLLWSAVQGILEVLAASMTNKPTSWYEVLALLWAPRAQFWFLYVLFLLFIIAALSSRLLLSRTEYGREYARLSPWLYTILPAALLARLIRPLGPFPFPLDFLSFYGFYFFLGAGIYEYRQQLQKLSSGQTILHSILAGCGLALAVLVEHHILADTPVGQLPSTLGACLTLLISQLCASLSGGWLVCSLSMWLAATPMIAPTGQLKQHLASAMAQLGQAALAIYLMHILVGSGLRIVMHKLLHLQQPTLHFVLGFSLSMLLPFLLYRLSLRPALSLLRWSYEWPKARR